jgi:hypothetical protein
MNDENKVVEVIEQAEEVVVEIIKAPFKIASDLFEWAIWHDKNSW